MRIVKIALILSLSFPATAQVYPSPLQKWAIPSARMFTTHNIFLAEEKLAMTSGMRPWNITLSFAYADGGYANYNPPANGQNASDRPCDSQSGIGTSYYVAATAAADARTCINMDSATIKTITDGDIWINLTMLDNEDFWTDLLLPPPANKIDLQSVITHELGHLLKLNHDSYSTSVVMYPSLSKGVSRRVLHTRDRVGRETLYP